MTFEQMERAMNFIVESLARSAARQQEIEENFKRHEARSEAEHFRLQAKIDALADVTLKLVEVERIHSRRLDRLEGLTPS